MKHELADSSGSQTTLSLKHYRITRVSEGRKKKGERHLETSIIDHFLEESECLFFFPINVHAFTFCLHFLICIQLYSFSDSCTWFFFVVCFQRKNNHNNDRKTQSIFHCSHKRLPPRGLWSSLQQQQHRGTALPLLNAIHAQQCWTFSIHAELEPLSLFLCCWKGYQQGNYTRNLCKKDSIWEVFPWNNTLG